MTGQVVKKTLDGETVMKFDTPPVSAYQEGDYKPTWVAVNEERHGGDGDVWVADGYGASQVHRYTKEGEYLTSITGEEGEPGHSTARMPSSSIRGNRSRSSTSPTAATAVSRSTAPRATGSACLGPNF